MDEKECADTAKKEEARNKVEKITSCFFFFRSHLFIRVVVYSPHPLNNFSCRERVLASAI